MLWGKFRKPCIDFLKLALTSQNAAQLASNIFRFLKILARFQSPSWTVGNRRETVLDFRTIIKAR